MRKIDHADTLHGPILKKLLCFALPIMAVGLLSMQFPAADRAVIGKFSHAGAASAISACSSLTMLVGGGVMALAGGVIIVLGQLYGRKEKDLNYALFPRIENRTFYKALLDNFLFLRKLSSSSGQNWLYVLKCPVGSGTFVRRGRA